MPPRASRPALAALSAFAAFAALFFAWAPPARAWVDVTVEGDDVRLTVERSGEARVEHRILLKIAGGPLRAFDLRGVDADAAPDADGYVVPHRAGRASSLADAVPIAAELVPPGNKPDPDGAPEPPILRIRFDNEKGLGRGVYMILVRYRTNLASRITADGALAKLEWRGPIWNDGLASARIVAAIPSAPTPPRAEDGPRDSAAPGDAPLVLSTVRRLTTADEIELLRPYAPKGEAITWTLRTDARAFQKTSPGAVKPVLDAPRAEGVIPAPARRGIVIAAAIAIFAIYTALVARKGAAVEAAAKEAGVDARPLIRWPLALRAALAGLALTAGIATQMIAERATPGALLVLAAAALATHLTPRRSRTARLRGPGRWLPVAEAEALRDPPKRPGSWLDASTRKGAIALVLTLAALFGGAFFLAEISPFKGTLLALDAAALLALVGTGRRSELPPDPAVAPAPFLRDVARRVRRARGADDLRVVGRIRVPTGSAEPDEVRLTIAPRAALTGLVAIEVGVIYAEGAGGSIALPEVLVRVTEGSPADRATEELAALGRVTRGRKPNERVLAFSPRLPTARMTAGLVARLVEAFAAPAKPQIDEAPAPRSVRERRAA